MITRTSLTALLAGLFVAGCATTGLPPDGANHPASPEAPAAAVPPPSETLAIAGRAASPVTAPAAYSCPHHPEVVSHQPGDCPKCGMALTPKPATQPAQGHDPSAHQAHSGHQGHSGHQNHSGHGGHGGHP